MAAEYGTTRAETMNEVIKFALDDDGAIARGVLHVTRRAAWCPGFEVRSINWRGRAAAEKRRPHPEGRAQRGVSKDDPACSSAAVALWSVLRDATPAAPLLRMRRLGSNARYFEPRSLVS